MCVQMIDVIKPFLCGLGGLVVSALDFLVGCCGFESRSSRDNFQTISTPSLYLTCPGLSIKWTKRRLVADSGTKCAWVIHESKAVQIHVHTIAAASMCHGCSFYTSNYRMVHLCVVMWWQRYPTKMAAKMPTG